MKSFHIYDSMVIGHGQIDAEHQQLAGLFNDIVERVEASDQDGARGKVDAFVETVKIYLANEEAIMRELDYNHFDAHKIEHGVLERKIWLLLEDIDEAGITEKILQDLKMALADDIIRSDMGFKTYLEAINYRE